jgi:hypothetical protein
MSTSSLLSGSNTVVHLSSFQSGNQQSNITNTNTLPLPPPPPQTKSAAATKPVLTNGILANSQPPKPPERSCSFKDVDNLQQQQQTVESTTTTTTTNNNSQNSKRQRSLTNKEPSGFCLKSLMNAVQTTPVVVESSVNNSDANQISNRPISRHFGNTDSPQQQQSNIKITSMKFGNEIINSSDLNLKNGWYYS